MSSARAIFFARVGFYLFCIAAYLSAVFVFWFVFHNMWACIGYFLASVLMSLRLWIFVTSVETLYKVFPLGSIQRILYQSFFLSLGFGLLIFGFWLLAEEMSTSRPWTGESYYCSMVGIWCASKWGFFLTIPIYNLRPDITDPEYKKKMCTQMKAESGVKSDTVLSSLSVRENSLV